MRKMVLAGNRAEYDVFIQKLWEKDKDISAYSYINRFHNLRGMRDIQIVRVGNYRNHRDCEMILQEARVRGFMPPVVTKRPQFTSGGIVTSAWVNEPRITIPNGSFLTSSAATLSADTLRTARDRMDAMMHNIPREERLRGLSTDNAIFDESSQINWEDMDRELYAHWTINDETD